MKCEICDSEERVEERVVETGTFGKAVFKICYGCTVKISKSERQFTLDYFKSVVRESKVEA